MKHPLLVSAIDRLSSDLGEGTFVVVDHWDDESATGVAHPDDPRFLVYVAVQPESPGVFDCECERPATSGDLPYDGDGIVTDVSYDNLLAAIRNHLHQIPS